MHQMHRDFEKATTIALPEKKARHRALLSFFASQKREP